MAITYQVEKLENMLPEIKLLLDAHWEEVALDKDVIKLNPDYDKYLELSYKDILHCVTVREDGQMVGYHLSFIMPHLHYKDSLTAFTDIFFLRKDKRKGTIGIKLLKFMEQSLKEKNVQKIYMGTKLHIDISPILTHLGYRQIEKSFAKVI
jgi:predicted acetyltransferase